MNVVPNQFTIGFDIRITPTTNIQEFEEKIRQWTEEVSLTQLALNDQFEWFHIQGWRQH